MIYSFNLEIKNTIFNNDTKSLIQHVSISRQQKIFKYLFDTDRILSLYGALLVRMALSNISGIPAQELTFSYGKYGKPYLSYPDSLYFNLSHTPNHIFCCISTSSSVGADVEKLRKPPYEIMESFFHPDEKKYVETASFSMKTRSFYEIWTKKEAYLKKIGTGITQQLKNINTCKLPLSYHTYQIQEYLCSICYDSNSEEDIKKITLCEKDILTYFTNA